MRIVLTLIASFGASIGASLMLAATASAAPVGNPVAIFSGLDKITGRIIAFGVAIDETVQFGALQITPRVCNTRPPTEPAQTTSFVEVDEITLQNEVRRIFTGWMFAASPGLSAIEHPVYDVWLVDCKAEITAAPATGGQEEPSSGPKNLADCPSATESSFR